MAALPGGTATPKNPTVSILTPVTTERCESFAHNMVRNLQRSAYNHDSLELIVVVSGAHECEELKKAAEADFRIKVHFHHLDDGKSVDTGVVRNEALGRTSGDFVVAMDDDDVYGPQYIGFMVNKLLTNSSLQLVNLHEYFGIAIKKDGSLYFQVGHMGEKTGATFVFRRSLRTKFGCEYTNTTGQDENKLHSCIVDHFGESAIQSIELSQEPDFKSPSMYVKSSWALQTTSLNFKNEAVARQLGYEPMTATDHVSHFDEAVTHKLVGREKKKYLDRVGKALQVVDMLISADMPVSQEFDMLTKFCSKTGDMQLYNCIAAA